MSVHDSVTTNGAAGFWAEAEQHPSRIAIVAPTGAAITYGELYDRVNRLARLWRRWGLAPGDHISFYLRNRPEVYELALAATQIGLYYTPINFHLLAGEVSYILKDSESVLFVADESLAETAVASAASAGIAPDRLLSVGAVPGFADLREAVAGESGQRPDDRSLGSWFFYTSGTTGLPKGVLNPTPDMPLDDALRAMATTYKTMATPMDVVHLVQGPLYHSGPLGFSLPVLHSGGTVVLMDRWTPEDALASIERHRVATTFAVPAMFHRLLSLPEDVRNQFDVSSLAMVVHSAAMCPVPVKQRMMDWWGPVLHEVYGGTEMVPTRCTPEEWLARPGTVGKPASDVRLEVLDESGNPVPGGEVGTIYFRRDGAALPEYYNDLDKTDSQRMHGLFTLGDMGYVDDDGWLFLVDRRTDLIIFAGSNVYPAEVEAVLLEHPGVEDVAVIGLPNEVTGHEVKAVVVARAGWSADDLLAREIMDFALQRLASYKCPRSIDFRPELPRSDSGKLYKRRLREEYMSGVDGQRPGGPTDAR